MIKIMNLRHMFGPALVPMAFVLSGFFCSPSEAQLPSQNRFSPINYFGRWQGFGYSDGYHACKEGRCPPKLSFSSFYGEPTSPPSSPLFHGHRAANVGYSPQLQPHQYSHSVHPYSQSAYAGSQGSAQPSPAPYYPGNAGTGMSPPAMQPAEMAPYQPPQQMAPVPSSPPPSFYETVPPAPLRKPESPSDKDYFELPPPPNSSDDLLPAAPSVNSRRVPPGNQSLLHQSNYRKR